MDIRRPSERSHTFRFFANILALLSKPHPGLAGSAIAITPLAFSAVGEIAINLLFFRAYFMYGLWVSPIGIWLVSVLVICIWIVVEPVWIWVIGVWALFGCEIACSCGEAGMQEGGESDEERCYHDGGPR